MLTIFLLTLSTSAEVLKYDIVGYSRKLFSYKAVCEKMVSNHMLLVSPINPNTLDCMGKQVKVKKFCKAHVGSENLLRGYVNKKMDEVVCEYGAKAFLSLGCDKAHKSFCVNPKAGCMKLKNYYAMSLSLNHHAFIEKDIDNVLNCYYEMNEVVAPAIVSRKANPWEEKEVIDRDLFEFSKVERRFTGKK